LFVAISSDFGFSDLFTDMDSKAYMLLQKKFLLIASGYKQ